MCDDCAFKLGTRPNQSKVTVEDAAQAVAYEMSTFHCHLEDHVCRGYLYAKEAFKK